MNNDKLKFMDFCAGIGGGRLGLEKSGMKCVAFSEIDKSTEKTYREIFGDEEKNYGDLMNINTEELPYFDVLIAGFPCQTFSVIGQRNGLDDTRGQVIYGIIKILSFKKTSYFILENVKGLVNHDNGKTLKKIIVELENAGYKVSCKVLNSLFYGVPQMRERVYFVGIRKDLVKPNISFEWPKTFDVPKLDEYLIDDIELDLNEKVKTYNTFLQYLNNKYNKGSYKIEEFLNKDYLVLDTRQSDLRLYHDKLPTLRTGRHGILYVRNGKFRKLSGFESLLLQGFPKEIADRIKTKIPNANLLSQAGNAMTINTIEAIGESLINYIKG